MNAVCGDEVDERLLMLGAKLELEPVAVRPERRIARGREQLAAHDVQRRDAFAAAARDVQHGQVQRQAEQVAAHGVGDELVDLVADLPRPALEDRAGGLGRAHARPAQRIRELARVEEAGEQRDVEGRAVGPGARDRLGQHRVAEAVGLVRELGEDGRIGVALEVDAVADEHVDRRHQLARELLEHEMLILHLGDEAGRLEHALAPIPSRARMDVTPCLRLRRRQQRVDEAANTIDAANLCGQPVVLRVEDRVDRAQGDVLVAAPVAGHQMHVQQRRVVARVRRVGGVRDVVEKRVARLHRVGQRNRCAWIPLQHSASAQDHLREAVGAAHESPVGIGREQRHVEDIGIDKADSEHGGRLRFHLGPVGDVAAYAVDHLAGRMRLHGAGRGVQTHLVLAQEHLVRWMRRVRLVLIDERRRLVRPLLDVVGGPDHPVRPGKIRGPGQDHEVALSAWYEQRVILLQGDEDGAAAALVHQIEAVIEELAEEGEHLIEGRAQTDVGGDVGDEERTGRRDFGERTGGGRGRRVIRCLVDDQVADDPRLRVGDDVVRQLSGRNSGCCGTPASSGVETVDPPRQTSFARN